MKKPLFNFLLLLIVLNSAAQKDTSFAIVKYKQIHIEDTLQPQNPSNDVMVLLIGKKITQYLKDESLMNKQKILSNEPVRNSDVSNGRESTFNGKLIYSNMLGCYKSLQNSTTHTLFAYSTLYEIEETTPLINWKIIDSVKIIQNLKCQKAIAEFRGRTYEAWFSLDITYNLGPWKLGGLPGLIIEAYDIKKEVVFEFVSYETDKNIVFEKPSNTKKVSAKEYRKYLEQTTKYYYIRDNKKYSISIFSPGGLDGVASPTNSEGVQQSLGVSINLNNHMEKVLDKN